MDSAKKCRPSDRFRFADGITTTTHPAAKSNGSISSKPSCILERSDECTADDFNEHAARSKLFGSRQPDGISKCTAAESEHPAAATTIQLKVQREQQELLGNRRCDCE